MSKSYKTTEACRVLDVQPYVLRYWETEFAALGGKKSGSQRVYSEEEIGVLKRIKELLYDEGYTMGGAKKRLAAELEETEDAAESPPAQRDAGAKRAASAKGRSKKAPSKKAKTKTAPSKKASKASAKEADAGPADLEQSAAANGAESLDTAYKVQIETTQLELRKLHAAAKEILDLVRAAK